MAAAGAGHGTYLLVAILFPLPMLVAIAVGSINVLASMLALAQYPIYGVMVAGTQNMKQRWLVVASLHFAVAVLSLLSVQYSEAFR